MARGSVDSEDWRERLQREHFKKMDKADAEMDPYLKKMMAKERADFYRRKKTRGVGN